MPTIKVDTDAGDFVEKFGSLLLRLGPRRLNKISKLVSQLIALDALRDDKDDGAVKAARDEVAAAIVRIASKMGR